jgi:hydrogenase maturation protease
MTKGHQIVRDSQRILVIGIGNEYRTDDAAGLIVARRVKEMNHPHVTIGEESGEGVALMEAWKGVDAVVVIDAVHSGAQSGTVHRLDAHAQSIPARFFHCSTHTFGVAEAIELSRALNQLPPRLILYGIEGENFDVGARLSSGVERAVQKVVASVVNEGGR